MSTRQKGIGLIEILIAVIILSIGFLATARMQVQGIRASQQAYLRSQATFMLKDMADRMRSNQAGVDAGFYDGLSTLQNIQPASCASATATTACTPAMITQNDLAEWTAYLSNPGVGADFTPLLPSTDTIQASGEINLIGNIYNLTVVWGEMVSGEEVTQSQTTRLLP